MVQVLRKVIMLNKINISSSEKILIIYIVLAAITLAVFWQVNQYDFVILDDVFYVTMNSHVQSGIAMDGVCWAFSTKYFGFWNPLVWISFMADYKLYSLNAGAYHMTNLILHILSTILLFWLFCRMTGAIWESAFVAALFALHPMHVESVAWISERKDVLSAFFWMLTLCLYVYYTEKPVIKRYLLVLFSFVLALMSKPMVVTLPVIMILLDYWPLKRFGSQRGNLFLWQLKEKIPFFVLSVALVIITFYNSNTPDISTTQNLKQFPLISRLANVPVAFVTYLEKTFWPHDMAVLYPFTEQIPLWQVIGALLLILVITIFVILMLKRLPYLFVGWLWFAISIAPVIGIIQISLLVPYAMADRYHYLPSIGIDIMLAWGIPFLFKREHIRKKVLFPTGFATIAILAFLSWKQCCYWKNSFELFNHAVQVTKDNYLAHQYLGIALYDVGKLNEAIFHYNNVIRLKPDYAGTYINRGNAYDKIGQYNLAIGDYNKAISLTPDYAVAYFNRGVTYGTLGQYQLAIEDYSKAILLKPNNFEAYHKRGYEYAKVGQYQRAIDDYNKAIFLSPGYSDAYTERGITYGRSGQYQLAIVDFNEAVRLKSDNAEAYNNRGFTYYNIGQYKQAIDDYNKAISLKSDYVEAYMNRGVAYLKHGNYTLGCHDAQKACVLGNCKTLESAKAIQLCH